MFRTNIYPTLTADLFVAWMRCRNPLSITKFEGLLKNIQIYEKVLLHDITNRHIHTIMKELLDFSNNISEGWGTQWNRFIIYLIKS